MDLIFDICELTVFDVGDNVGDDKMQFSSERVEIHSSSHIFHAGHANFDGRLKRDG